MTSTPATLLRKMIMISLNTGVSGYITIQIDNYTQLFIILKYLAAGLLKPRANNILSDHNVRHENYFFQQWMSCQVFLLYYLALLCPVWGRWRWLRSEGPGERFLSSLFNERGARLEMTVMNQCKAWLTAWPLSPRPLPPLQPVLEVGEADRAGLRLPSIQPDPDTGAGLGQSGRGPRQVIAWRPGVFS